MPAATQIFGVVGADIRHCFLYKYSDRNGSWSLQGSGTNLGTDSAILWWK